LASELCAKGWEVSFGTEVLTAKPPPLNGILFSVALRPDGKRIVAGVHGGKLLVWDAKGNWISVLGEHPRRHTIFNVVFSPDGRYLASATLGGSVLVWDAAKLDTPGEPLFEVEGSTPESTDNLAFIPGGNQLVVPHDGRTAKAWDILGKRETLRFETKATHGFRALASSSDGRWLASGGVDSAVQIWDTQTGALLHRFAGHRGDIMRLKFASHPRGTRLISASRDGAVKVWDLSAIPGSTLQKNQVTPRETAHQQ